MQQQTAIIDCYNKAAEAYAARYSDELEKKHFDRIILETFARNHSAVKAIDLGCGPGQTTKFLFDHGVQDIVGTDIAPGMIAAAKNLYPGLAFEAADMLSLPYPPGSFDLALAFYAIVHFDYEQAGRAFREIRRVL